MGASVNITAAVFAAYLNCPTKAFLTAHDEKHRIPSSATHGRISAAHKARVIGLTDPVPIDFLRLANDPAVDAPPAVARRG
jgi:hypothetical protein